MSSHRWTCCRLLLSALFLLATLSANAQNPGICNDTWANSCTSSNTCPAPAGNPTPPSCTVQISHDSSNNAVIQYNNTTVSDICTYPSQPITWTENEPSSAQFLLTFLSTPFNTNTYYFAGSTGSNAQGTIVSSPTAGCFKFSIRQQVLTTIYSADPKVVVHGFGK